MAEHGAARLPLAQLQPEGRGLHDEPSPSPSPSPRHVEDQYLYSTSYLHEGACKTWYSVSHANAIHRASPEGAPLKELTLTLTLTLT